jgi:hypothetical protein
VRLSAGTLGAQFFSEGRQLLLTALSSYCELQPAMTPKTLTHNIRISAIMPKNFRLNRVKGD